MAARLTTTTSVQRSGDLALHQDADDDHYHNSDQDSDLDHHHHNSDLDHYHKWKEGSERDRAVRVVRTLDWSLRWEVGVVRGGR